MGLSCRLTALGTALAFSLCSCATDTVSRRESRWSSPQACITAHTVGGALAGAASGALVAAIAGKRVGRGAAIGTVAGGTLAFAHAWGKCFASFTKVSSVQSQGYRATRSRIGYQPSQGAMVRIAEHGIHPSAITPGDRPVMRASYFVMAPGDQDVTVRETVALKVYNPEKNVFEEVGSTSETIVARPGERKASSEIPIPSNAEEGNFFIVLRVEMLGQKDEKEMPLTITGDETILAKARSDAMRHNYTTATGSSVSSEPMATATLLARAGSKDMASNNGVFVTVTAAKAAIRATPDSGAQIVAQAAEGDKFRWLQSKKVNGQQWHQIRLSNGRSAWITAATCKTTE